MGNNGASWKMHARASKMRRGPRSRSAGTAERVMSSIVINCNSLCVTLLVAAQLGTILYTFALPYFVRLLSLKKKCCDI
jgi:hypothetical protein